MNKFDKMYGVPLNKGESIILIDLIEKEIENLDKEIEIAKKYNLHYKAFEIMIKEYKLLIAKLEF
jgi:hypothetical protein